MQNNSSFLHIFYRVYQNISYLCICKNKANKIKISLLTFKNTKIMANKQNDINPVSVRFDDDGKPMGVRIRTIDEDFTIALHDACDHDVTADEARSLGQAFTLRQAHILCAYLEDVQDALEEAGGDRLDGWYVTCADYYAYDTWYFNSTSGCVFFNLRYIHYFRSRPVLALPLND